MQINNDKSLYNPHFTANILILGKKELLSPKQINELAAMVKPLGRSSDVFELDMRSDVMDMVEVNRKKHPKKFLSGFKMFVKSSIQDVKDTDLSVAKTQQVFWERYEELSPFGVVKSWINAVKKNIPFDIKEINDKPRLYNASNTNWVNNASFFVRDKKTPKAQFKVDIYKFQKLCFSEANMTTNYNRYISQAKRDRRKVVNPDDIIASITEGNNGPVSEKQLRELINRADVCKGSTGGVQTQKLYSDLKGHYNPARTVIHDKILNEIFINSDSAKPASGSKPTFIMLGGRAGSGKTKFGKDCSANVYNKTSYIVLNSDDIKRKLPEYNGFNDGELHEESIDIINKAIAKAKHMGLNTVLDCTMSHIEYCEPILKGFSESGYNIELYFMYLPREEAAKRAILRFVHNNRYVPLKVLLGMTDNEITFHKLRKYATKSGFYSNEVKPGQDPYLINIDVPNFYQWAYGQCQF